MDQKLLIKVPRQMKRKLDQLRIRKGINTSAFVRLAIARALRRAA